MKAEREERRKMTVCIERSTERLEEVVQRLGRELSGTNQKMEELKVEVCHLGWSVWRDTLNILRSLA